MPSRFADAAEHTIQTISEEIALAADEGEFHVTGQNLHLHLPIKGVVFRLLLTRAHATRPGYGHTMKDVHRAIAVAREWRRHDTIGPPAACVRSNRLTEAVLEALGVERQDFLDRLWSHVQSPHDGLPAIAWDPTWLETGDRNGEDRLGEDEWPAAGDRPAVSPRSDMHGDLSFERVEIHSMTSRDGMATFSMRPNHSRAIIRSQIPETFVGGLLGMRLHRVMGNPATELLDMTVRQITQIPEGLQLTFTGPDVPVPDPVPPRRPFSRGKTPQTPSEQALDMLHSVRHRM